jgi:hypothetical protein
LEGCIQDYGSFITVRSKRPVKAKKKGGEQLQKVLTVALAAAFGFVFAGPARFRAESVVSSLF